MVPSIKLTTMQSSSNLANVNALQKYKMRDMQINVNTKKTFYEICLKCYVDENEESNEENMKKKKYLSFY